MVAAAAALAVLDLGLSGGHRVRGTSSVGRDLPPASQVRAMKGTDLDGRPVTVSGFAGRTLVVNFFGSWCPPCRREASVFPAVARQFEGRVSFLSVAVSDTAPSDRAFAERYGWTWPIMEDNGYRWSVAFDLLGLPSTYVLDPRGRVVDRIIGPVAYSGLSAALRLVVPHVEGRPNARWPLGLGPRVLLDGPAGRPRTIERSRPRDQLDGPT